MPVTINPFQESPLAVFKKVQTDNVQLSDTNLDRTFLEGLKLFQNDKPIKELLEDGPINWEGGLWDFELNYGLRSLVRRGFYKIIEDPFIKNIPNLRTGEEIPTWSAQVLFCPEVDFKTYFKFLANVGPLVNTNAIGFNFTDFGPQILASGSINMSKDVFFQHMLGKVFYVTQQLYVDTFYKQTVWFKIE